MGKSCLQGNRGTIKSPKSLSKTNPPNVCGILSYYSKHAKNITSGYGEFLIKVERRIFKISSTSQPKWRKKKLPLYMKKMVYLVGRL
jgi:hypothetical protein